LKEHPFHKPISDVFYWEEIVKSGLVFAIGNFFFFLVVIGEYSVLTLFSYMALTVLAVSFGYLKFQLVRGSENPFIERFQKMDKDTARRFIQQHSEAMYKIWDSIRDGLFSIFFSANISLAVKASLVLFILSLLGKMVQFATFLFIIFLFMFIWPRLYREKHEQIDFIAGKVFGVIQSNIGMVLSKLPIQKFKRE